MIKIKAKYNWKTGEIGINYNAKKTNTFENLYLINEICEAILKNQEGMTMNDIFKEVKKINKELEREK